MLVFISHTRIIEGFRFDMVAWQATNSGPQQILVKGKQRLIDLKNVIVSLLNKIFDDHIKLAAAGQCIAGLLQHISGFRQRKLQGNGKGDDRRLTGLILDIPR